MFARICTAVAIMAAAQAGVFAQSAGDAWPSKPIRAIVPLGAGSATDIVPRIVFEQLSNQLGQPIIVENRPGAGTTIGTNAVAKADPDGYTLLATSSAYSVAPSIQANLNYDPLNDLSPIITFVGLPNVFVISPDKGFKTIQEFVAAARAKPGSITFASVGVGSGTHFNAERFRHAAKFEAVHVPFKGGPEALTEVMTGRVDFYFCPINTALPFIREGKLVALAMGTRTRSSLLPNVPTTIEAGYVNSNYEIWLGLLAPAKTPRAIIEKLHRETAKALLNPSVKEKLAKTGLEPLIMSTGEFAARIKSEIGENAAIVKAAGANPN